MIVLSFAVFFIALSNMQVLTNLNGVNPFLIFRGESLHNLVTSIFFHSNIFFVSLNMWLVWLFGGSVESKCGWVRFLIFYVLSGVISALVFSLSNLGSTTVYVGSSGATAALLGAYVWSFPRGRVKTMTFSGKKKRLAIFKVAYISSFVTVFFWVIVLILIEMNYLIFLNSLTLGVPLTGFLFGTLVFRYFKSDTHWVKMKLKKGLTAIRVSGAACNSCRKCVEACPADAIKLSLREINKPYSVVFERKKIPFIDTYRCNECGKCVQACPTGALFTEDAPEEVERS